MRDNNNVVQFPTDYRGGPLLSDAFMDMVADLKTIARTIPPGLFDHDMLRMYDKNGDCHGAMYVSQFRNLLADEINDES